MEKHKLYELRPIPELPEGEYEHNESTLAGNSWTWRSFSAAQMDAHAREAWTAGLDCGMQHAPAADETTLPDLARPLGAASKEGKAVKLSAVAAGALYNAMTTAAASAPPAPCQWRRITAPGQVNVGDRMRFMLGDDVHMVKAKLILNQGTGREEIIYARKNNFYIITSLAIAGRGSQKEVEFLPGSGPDAALVQALKDCASLESAEEIRDLARAALAAAGVKP